LNKKLSKKDLKTWKDFVEGKGKLYDKDIIYEETKYKKKNSTIDLHGFSLDQANRKIEKFIISCYQKKIEKLNIITGKGLRSRVEQNPYQSKDLSILKYSVPEFIKSNSELMRLIKKIEDKGDNKNSGCFTLYLKIKE
jgi:DNA-nicking Smr family endonuclease|tara:strand:- start:224 stop:637 length:414 start_codon:yes stop_codon:yes gene_type:complete